MSDTPPTVLCGPAHTYTVFFSDIRGGFPSLNNLKNPVESHKMNLDLLPCNRIKKVVCIQINNTYMDNGGIPPGPPGPILFGGGPRIPGP